MNNFFYSEKNAYWETFLYSRAHVRSRGISFSFFLFKTQSSVRFVSNNRPLLARHVRVTSYTDKRTKGYRIYIYIFLYTCIYVYTIHMYLHTYDQLRVDRRNHVFHGWIESDWSAALEDRPSKCHRDSWSAIFSNRCRFRIRCRMYVYVMMYDWVMELIKTEKCLEETNFIMKFRAR